MARGNSLTRINPVAGTLGSSIFIGSEPSRLAISSNNQYIYAGLDGAGAVRRFNVLSQSPEIQITLGFDETAGPLFADDIAVMPGIPTSIAVSRRAEGVSPRHQGIAIFDNIAQRGTVSGVTPVNNRIAFANPSMLLGLDTESATGSFRRITVTGARIGSQSGLGNALGTGSGGTFTFDGLLAISSSGRTLDPITPVLAGTFTGANGLGGVVADLANDRVFFLNNSTMQVYQCSTYIPMGTIEVPGAANGKSLIRWGEDGLAFRADGDRVYLVNSSLVPTPGAGMLLGLGGLLVTSRRRR